MDKWVINLSRTPLTMNQLTLLQKGPNFAIIPKYLPIDVYIMATELASSKLPTQEADEFRSDVNRFLKEQQQQHHNNCNLNPTQHRALTQLKQDNTWWFSQWTRGWPWSLGTNRSTAPRHKPFYKTPIPTKSSPKTLPLHSKISSSTFSRTSSSQEASAPKSTNNFTPPVQSPQVLWPSQNT